MVNVGELFMSLTSYGKFEALLVRKQSGMRTSLGKFTP